MTEHREEFVLITRDDGRGITTEDRDGVHSLGILGMHERAHLAGGTVEIREADNGGTVVTVRVSART
jgi:signal transduction histidine kinase